MFRVVRALARHRVISLHMGYHHSAVIVEPGHVYTFGRNSDGQLGTGNFKQQGGPIGIKLFEGNPAFVSVLAILFPLIEMFAKQQAMHLCCLNNVLSYHLEGNPQSYGRCPYMRGVPSSQFHEKWKDKTPS